MVIAVLEKAERGFRRLPFGNRIFDFGYDWADYLMNKRNPSVQIFYLAVAGGGYVIYVVRGMINYLPGPYLGEYHWYTGSFLMFVAYYSFYRACTDDPGIIKDKK